jgi:voltage-gated potassium channel
MQIEILKRFKQLALMLITVLFIGTLGYWLISGGKYSIFECLYMSVITILTIGYEEIIKSEPGETQWIRVFTIFLAFTGLGIITYIFSKLTASAVEDSLKETYKKRKTNKILKHMKNHYIVCGAGMVGSAIINELYSTKREIVVIDMNAEIISELEKKFPGVPIIHGNADFENVLIKAGIKTAVGIFAATGDDNLNVIICLTAKYINPQIRVVTRCLDEINHNKMEKAGADAVIKENSIAGMRMASEMIRPIVAIFLDKMLKEKDENLRVEEIPIHNKYANKKIAELELDNFSNSLLLAVVSGDQVWTYKPKANDIVRQGSRLVVITNPEERENLTKYFSSD